MMAAPPNPSGHDSGLHTCPSQKNVYLSRDDALRDRRRIMASRGRAKDAQLYVYQCDRCDQFHLSSDKRQATLRRMRHYFDAVDREAQRAVEAEVEERRKNTRPPG